MIRNNRPAWQSQLCCVLLLPLLCLPSAAKAQYCGDSTNIWKMPASGCGTALALQRRVSGLAWLDAPPAADPGPSASPGTVPSSPAVLPTSRAPSSDPLIASIQTLLMVLGFDVGSADGVNGPQTSKAITQFQVEIGDKTDGQPSEVLRSKLQKVLAERGPGSTSRNPATKRPRAEVIGSGSGFFIGPEIIVTNHHVIDGCSEIRTRRNGVEIGSARVVAVNRSDDLAALRSEKPSDAHLDLRVGAPLKPAESILVFGYPLTGALSSSVTTHPLRRCDSGVAG